MQTQNLIRAGYCWHIKGARRINIWCEPWVPTLPGYTPKLKMGSVVEQHINYVSDLINPISHNWKETLICDLFDEESADAILKIPLPP